MTLYLTSVRALTVAAFLLFSLHGTRLCAQPVLHCEMTYAGTTQLYEARLQHDTDADAGSDTGGAYTIEAMDIGGRFRVKALLLGTMQTLNMIKLYIYYESDREPVLLQEVKYTAPFTYSGTPYSLTGHNYLYSPPLGRELQYGCALMEAQS